MRIIVACASVSNSAFINLAVLSFSAKCLKVFVLAHPIQVFQFALVRLIIHIYPLAVREVLITLRDREVTYKVHENTQHSSLVTSARF